MTSLWQRLFPTTTTKVLLGLYLASFVWWFTIFARGIVNTSENYLFNIPMALIPMIGSGMVLFQASRLHQLSSKMKVALWCLSLGLMSWGIGNICYLYYNIVLQIPVPSPSLPEIFYYLTLPLWFIGLVYFSLVVGLGPKMKHLAKNFVFWITPSLLIFGAYYLLLITTGVIIVNPLVPAQKIIVLFDIFGSIPDLFIMLVSFWLLYATFFKLVDAKYKLAMITFSGFIVNYIADIAFLYTLQQGTFFVGSWVDMVFLTAVFLQALGLNLLVVAHLSSHPAISRLVKANTVYAQ